MRTSIDVDDDRVIEDAHTIAEVLSAFRPDRESGPMEQRLGLRAWRG